MANMNLTYRVTGRYMTGSTVVAYHLVGSDGSQVVANKDRAIYMIGRGQIENMRIQVNGEDILVRGKGINLNNLPVFDTNKNGFRSNTASQETEATRVNPKKNSGINPMGQLKLTKRIMYQQNCLGYIVEDRSGHEMKLNRKRVVELATEKLICNAVIQKYTPAGTNESKIILRGIGGCEIDKLPIVRVDANGNIIDNEKIAKEQYVYMRATRMKRGGIIYDKNKNAKMAFEPGDYIVCGINGVLRPIKSADATNIIEIDRESSTAVCDEFLNNLENYPVESFGYAPQIIQPERVKNWPIVKVKRTK